MSLLFVKQADSFLRSWKGSLSMKEAGEDQKDWHHDTRADQGFDHKYYCGACEHLMRDPVQTECGHRFCLECHWALLKESMPCPSCLRDNGMVENGSCATLEKCFRDRAIAKEILNLQVYCRNEGCDWSGPLRELEVSGADLHQHKLSCIQQHLDYMLEAFRQGLAKQAPGSGASLALPEGVLGDSDGEELPRDTEEQHDLRVRVQTFENIVTVLNREVANTSNTLMAQERKLKEQETVTTQLRNKIQQHEKSICLKDLVIADLQLRLDILEHTSYDGTLVWAISDFTRKMQDAIDRKVPSIFSPPFFTAHCGYVLCLRLYLNGDGIGANTHLSLFLVIMKGKYDAILEWPFSKKVTFRLLDQSARRQHVVTAFKPDISSASFQRPVQAMNIASGCPEFLPLTQLHANWQGYVTDDVMFIKASVDS
ncbi:TNF receptor-associated factor 2-like isoform X2 [Chiloscyllium plagiosum]|uniref:TNF receptor-associated factor 2-like isoform X2 n=1 Tax=Chiloscyllium plagiosum TaxID=36176 RepID=UPI001CB7D610|nr:TNF receptor-associated factor 2-like isoform X2 [Chiloscyllium plagiosum]